MIVNAGKKTHLWKLGQIWGKLGLAYRPIGDHLEIFKCTCFKTKGKIKDDWWSSTQGKKLTFESWAKLACWTRFVNIWKHFSLIMKLWQPISANRWTLIKEIYIFISFFGVSMHRGENHFFLEGAFFDNFFLFTISGSSAWERAFGSSVTFSIPSSSV